MDEMQNEIDTVSEQIKEQDAQQASEAQASVVDETIPEKYRGKSLKQLAEELETANKNMGRYSNELGEVRKLADELIKSQLHKPKEQEVSREIDFFENPQEAIKRAVETNPEVQAAKMYAMQARQEQARQKLLSDHPDALNLAASEDFNNWVGKSAVRKELLNRAHNNFDVDAANELFTTYKELKAVRTQAISDTEKEARKQAVSSAAVDSGGSGERSKKIWKRTELLNMKIYEPRKYDAIQDEIDAAYREGRIR